MSDKLLERITEIERVAENLRRSPCDTCGESYGEIKWLADHLRDALTVLEALQIKERRAIWQPAAVTAPLLMMLHPRETEDQEAIAAWGRLEEARR